jgi:hypothetical protein
MRCSLHKFRAQTSTNPEWASELGEDFIGFARRKPVVDGSELPVTLADTRAALRPPEV